MITIKRHPNLDNWIEVRYFSKLLNQFSSRVQAYRFACKEAKDRKTKMMDLDKGEINYRPLKWLW